MIRSDANLRRFSWLAAAMLCHGVGIETVMAQVQTNVAATNTVIVEPPGLPPCPIELFRQLLPKDRAEQEQMLADRPPEKRRLILAKVREYRTLKPEVRQQKLEATELRWYLQQLIAIPAANHEMLLAGVPAKYRTLLEERLRYWDNLPPNAQEFFRTNEAARTYLSMPVAQKVSIPQTSNNRLEDGIQQFRSLPDSQLTQFRRFFDVKPEEKQKILSALPEAERQQIEKTLEKFAQLTSADREVCIQSFQKFANLSLEERNQFLRNAERWTLMSSAERQEWKNLVDNLTTLPPAPPGLFISSPPRVLPIRPPKQ